MGNLPRILLCAPASGGGKTTVTCALLQALVDRGVKPVAFKCGPDYIDPMFHSEVIGAKARNLDLYFLGNQMTRYLLQKNAQGGGLAVIEGVMGYYDGVAMSSVASAYELAKATQTPAVLVLDARGRALSAAAVVKGLCSFRTDSGILGVILNRVSPALYPRLRDVIEAECGVKVYGFLPELPDCALESRHLGLVTAAEVEGLKQKLGLLARQAERTIDLAGLLALAEAAPNWHEACPQLPEPVPGRPRIAVAKDAAFCFYYADGLDLLEYLGAELVPFSPLHDRELPPSCAGLYLGGGYPELYAGALSENRPMLLSVKNALQRGIPCVAECGGFLYLHDTLEDADGVERPMVGAISAQGVRTQRLGRFGYVTLTAERDNLLCRRGDTIPAHEFHYWDSTEPGSAFTARKPQSARAWTCAHADMSKYLGFPHFHFCARPESAARFVAACAVYQQNHGRSGFIGTEE